VSGSKWSALGPRVKTAAILASVSLGLIWWGVGWFLAEVLLLGVAGLAEFFEMAERKGLRPARRMGTLAVTLILASSAATGVTAAFSVYFACLIALMVVLVLRAARHRSLLLDMAVTWAGVSYLSLFSFLLLVRRAEGRVALGPLCLDKGAALVLLVVGLVALTDIGAYFIGRSIGRTPLYPSLSPNKTWEGTLGGLGCAALLMSWVAQTWNLPTGPAVFLGILVSVCSQVGDLWESALKREVGLKDSGDLLGAHGGVLDRFDSMAFAAPTFYLGIHYLGWI
jgi:phosphatidate cytidylyltransferase